MGMELCHGNLRLYQRPGDGHYIAIAFKALKVPELAARLRGMGFDPAPTTPEQFRDFIRNESAKFAKVIVEAGVKIEQ